jgi:hypothetical protein
LQDIFGYLLAIIVMSFLGYKGLACVRDPEGEREKLINSVPPGSFQDMRRSWTPVWFVRTWGYAVCAAISLVLVVLVYKAITKLF